MHRLAPGIVVILALPVLACDDPAPGAVVVHDRLGHPVADADVRVHGPDGALVATAATGSAGVAEVELPDGAAVTVADADRRFFASVLAVAGGQRLHVALPLERGGDFTEVAVPPLPAGANFAWLEARCVRASGGVSTFSVERLPCATPATTVRLTATGQAGQTIAYLVAPDVDLARPQVAITGTWQAPAGVTTITATDPLGAAWADVYRADLEDGYVVGGEHAFFRDHALTMPFSGHGDRALYRFSTDDSRYTFRVSSARDAVAIGAGDVLPRVTNATLAGHTVAWQGGAGGDFAEAWVDVHQGSGDVILEPQSWTVSGPADVTHLDFPPHPDFRWPSATAGTILSVGVRVTESSALAGYRDALARSGPATDDRVPLPVPPDFTMRTSTAFGR